MHKIMFFIGLCLSTYLYQPQQTDNKKDILILMQENGTVASQDRTFDQFVPRYKMMNSNVPWEFLQAAPGTISLSCPENRQGITRR